SAFAPVNVRERNSDSGNIGDCARASTATNAASAATPITSAATTAVSDQPRREDSMSPNTSPPSPTVPSVAPGTSSGPASGFRLSGTRGRSASTSAASGTFNQNAQRHEWSTSQPPSSGPTAVVMPLNPD